MVSRLDSDGQVVEEKGPECVGEGFLAKFQKCGGRKILADGDEFNLIDLASGSLYVEQDG